ncbi:MAG: rod shape-determining protein RodA [Kiritimatiellaceae bacterium]|nr:rod shape-determining protein RodA [Kiritimatiellaceae bacterium]
MIKRLFRLDGTLFISMVMLLALSCLFIHSADYRNEHAVGKLMGLQVQWIVMGLVCYVVAMSIDYRKLAHVHWWVYAAVLALLLLVFCFPEKNNAHRWIPMPGFSLQPSELAKVSVIITLAAWLGDPSTDIERFKTFVLAVMLAGIPFLLIAVEPDLGSAMILVPIAMLLLFCAGIPLRLLMTIVGMGVLGLVVLIVWLKWFPDSCPFLTEYQKSRILVFLDVTPDPLGAGWNKAQSQIAVGSGGLFGKGYLKGTQNILGFLPRTVAPTDFIHSVVAEELGFAGSSLLLVLYTTVVVRCIRVAVLAQDLFGRLMSAGVGVLIFSHVFINIAMTIGLMPITGVPLPLMSYGGTFMVCVMTALGLVQSVYLRRRV